MKKRTGQEQAQKPHVVQAGVLKRAGSLALPPVVTAVIGTAAAGRLDWLWMWIFVGVSAGFVLVAGSWAARVGTRSPPARSQPQAAGELDAFGNIFFLLAMYLAVPLVAGLSERFGWGRLPAAWHAAGAAAAAGGLTLVASAIRVNPCMWSEVAVQRGQVVCRAGPYRVIRHPGYAGTLLQALGVPLLLGSWWALIPGFAAAACMIATIRSEDRVLRDALPGYRDYARIVRHRLVPGIW